MGMLGVTMPRMYQILVNNFKMSVKPKVVNGLSCKFVCTMGAGPRTNLYRIGCDPLTQLKNCNNFF